MMWGAWPVEIISGVPWISCRTNQVSSIRGPSVQNQANQAFTAKADSSKWANRQSRMSILYNMTVIYRSSDSSVCVKSRSTVQIELKEKDYLCAALMPAGQFSKSIVLQATYLSSLGALFFYVGLASKLQRGRITHLGWWIACLGTHHVHCTLRKHLSLL